MASCLTREIASSSERPVRQRYPSASSRSVRKAVRSGESSATRMVAGLRGDVDRSDGAGWTMRASHSRRTCTQYIGAGAIADPAAPRRARARGLGEGEVAEHQHLALHVEGRAVAHLQQLDNQLQVVGVRTEDVLGGAMIEDQLQREVALFAPFSLRPARLDMGDLSYDDLLLGALLFRGHPQSLLRCPAALLDPVYHRALRRGRHRVAPESDLRYARAQNGGRHADRFGPR